MVVNAIAPFEGKLIWVGTPNGGFNQNNEEWKSVEFVIAYTDGKLQERQILFSAFGLDRVNRILSTPLGTPLRVTFQPTAREYNGKWYGKNDVLGITVIQPQIMPPPPTQPQQYNPYQGMQPSVAPQPASAAPQPAGPQQYAQAYPQPPATTPVMQQTPPTPDGDLPF